MRVYWLGWFMIGFGVPEAWALVTGRATLTDTWVWVQQSSPTWLAVALSAALAAALAWLLSVHWILNAWDRPGLDPLEFGVIVLGALVGTVGGLAARRRPRDEDV